MPPLLANFVYRLQDRILQRPTFAYLASLEASQWLDRADIERLQAVKLTHLLRIAAAHCPWHAERIQAADIPIHEPHDVTLEELRKLPIMTKADIRRHGDRMIWQDVPGGLYAYNTGGSTGSPLSFYFGRLRQASDAAGRMRARRWWGVNVGDRELFLWGAPVELNKTDRIKRLRDRLINQVLLNAFEMSPAQMTAYAKVINDFKPACIYGYASSLTLLCAHVKARGIKLRLPQLKVVCTTGEPLFPHQRALLEEVFGVPVANEFGSRDGGLIAHESPTGQQLLLSESVILEVVNDADEPVPPGTVGEAVLTGLCSEAQPFIRYRTGDMVRLSNQACQEGRGLHVLDEIIGRTTDFVVRRDGTIMHALSVIYVLREFKSINEFKFIQHSTAFCEILVVATPHWSADDEQKLLQKMAARLGDEVEVTVRLVERIEPEASGKYRYVVSHVAIPDTLNITREVN